MTGTSPAMTDLGWIKTKNKMSLPPSSILATSAKNQCYESDVTRKSDIDTLLDIMRRLREPSGGCPWDIEQTLETIAPYTIEEAYEVAGAIEDKDWSGLKDELGDLLLQVVYHARIAEERKLFDFHDVVDAISAKMIARHPHVFGDAKVENAEAQTVAWEEI